MAITIHDAAEIEAIANAGRVAAATLAEVGRRLRAGVSTGDIDRWVRADTAARGASPSQLGYRGFPGTVCTSRNDVVCHGIPRDDEIVHDGDIVNVDVTSCLAGWHGDTSVTFMIGHVPAPARRVVEVARACLRAGIEAVAPGRRLGDVAAAIVAVARAADCHLVEDFCGHGIGRRMHMPPQVPHVGRPGAGLRLRPGMTFTIEPMVTLGPPRHRLDDDGWTVRTCDGSPSAQFEHTVAVTERGVRVLTMPSAPIELQIPATAACAASTPGPG